MVYGTGGYAYAQRLERLEGGDQQHVRLEGTTNSGITTERVKAAADLDTVSARLNFRF